MAYQQKALTQRKQINVGYTTFFNREFEFIVFFFSALPMAT